MSPLHIVLDANPIIRSAIRMVAVAIFRGERLGLMPKFPSSPIEVLVERGISAPPRDWDASWLPL